MEKADAFIQVYKDPENHICIFTLDLIQAEFLFYHTTPGMKGIILAGGWGHDYIADAGYEQTTTAGFDKPMIYYPLSILMMAGIREILIISTPEDLPNFQRLLKTVLISDAIAYQEQSVPNGLARAFVFGADFIGEDKVALILGTIFSMEIGMDKLLLGCQDPGWRNRICLPGRRSVRPGEVEFDAQFNALSIEEKPQHPKSNFAVPGLYFYDTNSVIAVHVILNPAHAAYEITDVNQAYLQQGKLKGCRHGPWICMAGYRYTPFLDASWPVYSGYRGTAKG